MAWYVPVLAVTSPAASRLFLFASPLLLPPWLLLLNATRLPAAAAAEPAPPGPAGASSATADWQRLLTLDTGPRGAFRSREEALALAREHLARQETALRRFAADYPNDPHRADARTRLADVLAARARLPGETAPGLRAEAARLLAEVEADPASTPAQRADAAYARVRQAMQDSAGQTENEARRESLTRAIRAFDAAHPGDRRTPALLVELATLLDSRPAEKRALLEEILARASSPADEPVRARAADDLRRLALLGRPLAVKLPPAVNDPRAPLNLEARRGRVIVLLFWASNSPPALRELARLQAVAARWGGKPVDFLTVSLDEDRAALLEAIRQTRLTWPVHCDHRGWSGEAVRSLGLNALPTTWVLGRDGALLTLNGARQDVDVLIRQALER